MKKVSLLIFAILFLASCATTRVSKKISPAGEWDYTVTNTPEGDFAGTMIISLQDNVYSAKLNAQNNEIPVEDFAWDGTTKTIKGIIYYSGTPVDLAATLNGDELTGIMAAGGGEFPFKATRKK